MQVRCTAYNPTVDNAGRYLSSLEFVFNSLDIDCDKAYDLVDAVDNAKFSWIVNYFSGNDYSEKKQSIRGYQALFDGCYEAATLAWPYYLEGGYNPFSGQYDYGYSPLSANKTPIKKQIKVACPVDVYVYNSDGELVASVINKVLTCKDDDLMVAISGDEKTIHFYNDGVYRIEYVGTDTGTMDIGISEYDDSGDISRMKEYYNVPLVQNINYSMDVPEINDLENGYVLVETEKEEVVEPQYDTASGDMYSIAVKDGMLAYKDEILLSGSIPAGAIVSLQTEEPEGYVFDEWTTVEGNVSFVDSKNVNTTIVMPAENIVIKAVFKEKVDHLPGDINGDGLVSLKDVLWLLKYINKKPVEVVKEAVDVNGDGVESLKDVLWLLKFVNGKNVLIF